MQLNGQLAVVPKFATSASKSFDQVEQRSPERNDSMYIDNEVSITTPLTKGNAGGANGPVGRDGDEHVSEVDITSTHNSVMSATPESTIGAGQNVPSVKYTDLTHMSGKSRLSFIFVAKKKSMKSYAINTIRQ